MTTISPFSDRTIPHRYNGKTLENKVKNKTALQKELGWPAEPKRMMLCLPAGMTDALGGKLMEELLPGLLSLPVELLIRGKGSAQYGELFTKLSKENSHRIAIIPDTEEAVHAMYAAADAAIYFANSSGLKELHESLRFGVVPITPNCEDIESYDPIQESGCAFTYEELNVWHCFAAVVRALETQKFPFDWRTVQRYCMENA
ncbi:hypothetical protein KKF55_02460 [Patescibacteria group bacterium]|nr:hypothetical protein [Patescibacteria group bacterium]